MWLSTEDMRFFPVESSSAAHHDQDGTLSSTWGQENDRVAAFLDNEIFRELVHLRVSKHEAMRKVRYKTKQQRSSRKMATMQQRTFFLFLAEAGGTEGLRGDVISKVFAWSTYRYEFSFLLSIWEGEKQNNNQSLV